MKVVAKFCMLGVLAMAGYVVWFCVVSSVIFLYGAGLWHEYPYFKWTAWLTYWWYARSDPAVLKWLWISGVPAAALPIIISGSTWSYRYRAQGWMMVMRGSPAAPWARQPAMRSHGAAPFIEPGEAADELRR